jgi:hypothetical protein
MLNIITQNGLNTMQYNNNISKALEPYSRAFLIAQIWGKEFKNVQSYHKKIHDRFAFNNWHKFPLEIEKITIFLKSQKLVIDEFINCV